MKSIVTALMTALTVMAFATSAGADMMPGWDHSVYYTDSGKKCVWNGSGYDCTRPQLSIWGFVWN